jgi:hypothetical protein
MDINISFFLIFVSLLVLFEWWNILFNYRKVDSAKFEYHQTVKVNIIMAQNKKSVVVP